MNISIITLFPELYGPFFEASLIGRAREKNLISSDIVSLFDFTKPKQRIDSPTFGPGAGMLIRPEVVEQAIETQEQKHGKAFKIFFSPQGEKLTQKMLNSFAQIINKTENKHVLLVASRYEGMDSRVEEFYADAVISVGDFVLMGGDLPALCFVESFLRLIPGIVGKQESVERESFSGPFVDFPEYTAPIEWKGMEVPEVIRSGNHGLIEKWRERQAALKTVKNHFEWLRSFPLTKQQINLAKEFIPPHYAVLMHSDVLLKDNQAGTTSITSLDIHDIARSAATYGLKNYFIVTPLKDQQSILQVLLDFWQNGFGVEYNVHRHKAVNLVKMSSDIDEVIEQITKIEGRAPLLIATSAKDYTNKNFITYFDQTKVWKSGRPVLFLFGTGHGLAPYILDRCDFILGPICGFSDFNHLSVRAAASIIFDRWLGIKIKE